MKIDYKILIMNISGETVENALVDIHSSLLPWPIMGHQINGRFFSLPIHSHSDRSSEIFCPQIHLYSTRNQRGETFIWHLF